MNIALLHFSSPPVVGGVESVLASHARLMANAGHQVMILAGRGNSINDQISVRILPMLDSRHAEVLKIKAQLDQGKIPPDFERLKELISGELQEELKVCDILIVHNAASLNQNLPLSAAIHDRFSKPGFPRLILWHHDLAWTSPRYKDELHDCYPWNLLRSRWDGAEHVVVSEQRQKELSLLTGLPESSIKVIPNGIDVNAFYKLEPLTIRLVKELDLMNGDPLVLLPVRLTPRKNIELALRVLAELKHQFPKAMLLVTGPEGPHNPENALYKQRLLELRDALSLQGAAHFLIEQTTDFIPDPVIADLYRFCDLLFFPSREEGFGIPMIEAAFSSIPVFCADILVLRELGGDDVNYFSPDADPRSIASQISERLNNEMTSRWSRRAKHSYSWDSIYRLYIEPLILKERSK
jgi:glycosyltransferase involved in cell wall biosynthesis